MGCLFLGGSCGSVRLGEGMSFCNLNVFQNCLQEVTWARGGVERLLGEFFPLPRRLGAVAASRPAVRPRARAPAPSGLSRTWPALPPTAERAFD